MFPMFGFEGADAFVLRQVGYTIADVIAKAVFALLIYKIARLKSFYDDPQFALSELGEADHDVVASPAPKETAGSKEGLLT
jgi:hypothetical protein